MKVEVVTAGIEDHKSCEKETMLVKRVLKDFPQASFREINPLAEPERIQKLGFVDSGAVVIDGVLAFSKTPKEKNLRELLRAMSANN